MDSNIVQRGQKFVLRLLQQGRLRSLFLHFLPVLFNPLCGTFLQQVDNITAIFCLVAQIPNWTTLEGLVPNGCSKYY